MAQAPQQVIDAVEAAWGQWSYQVRLSDRRRAASMHWFLSAQDAWDAVASIRAEQEQDLAGGEAAPSATLVELRRRAADPQAAAGTLVAPRPHRLGDDPLSGPRHEVAYTVYKSGIGAAR